ncbi:MAG: glutamine phosphoribosylpyrophosphate amidotransferase [Planctomycetes bacterium]|nr:glutamine phosphoribosylpyrophosphate amidotransferase [Planctomycetota bacterium]
MCGIIGYLDKRGGHDRHVGKTLLSMLEALSCRGPDSAGVAVIGAPSPFWIMQVKLPEKGDLDRSATAILDYFRSHAGIVRHGVTGAYLRLEVEAPAEPAELEATLLCHFPDTEVVSLGHRLQIVKQVGSPAALEKAYAISKWHGSHGIGHTRMSTESRVDLSHSQPFWAHGVPDLATVHNGHITNYHKLRRIYEQRGYRFFTENDSEVIGIYLRERLAEGLSLPDALRSSLDDFDGSFSYLAVSADYMAYVKDSFGFKPLVVAETDDFVAIATEEIALRRALGQDFTAYEPVPGTLKIWTKAGSQKLETRDQKPETRN